MRERQTSMDVQLTFVEFIGDDGGGGQSYVGRGNSFLEVAQVFVELPHLFWTPSPPEAGLLLSLVHPVQGKSVKEGGVLVIAADAHELPFPVFVGLLEDGEDGPPNNPIEANP